KNNITDIQQTLALKTVWVAIVQPFLLNNFRSLENAFSDRIQGSAKNSKSPDIKKKEYYTRFANVLDIIKSIKMFDLINNKIVFSGGINSIYGSEGALIVIDGNKMGTDVSVLNALNTSEIENIEVSTKSQDVMQYTGLNAVGIVKIKTIGSGNIERYPDIVPSGQVTRKSFSPTPESLWWNTFVLSSQSVSKPIEFLPGEQKGSYLIRMEGIAADGKLLWGEKEITIE
ncbi:MAG: hypothetical protein PHS48_09090, partial [Bacteroidales bacterium]|nr:hypothetical protein [Bacteroidales bacterium]